MEIDELKAKEYARRFLEQYHSVVVLTAILEEGVWDVSTKVGLRPDGIRKVSVDAATGRILGYS